MCPIFEIDITIYKVSKTLLFKKQFYLSCYYLLNNYCSPPFKFFIRMKFFKQYQYVQIKFTEHKIAISFRAHISVNLHFNFLTMIST